MVEPIYDYLFRLILIGDSTVGKSSLLRYFTDGKFSEVSDPTVGVDFSARLIEVSNGRKIKLQLWDTAGQERFRYYIHGNSNLSLLIYVHFRSITKAYYRNSVGALVVFDVCNKKSLEHVPVWIMEAKRHIQPYQAVFLLVGTKIDMEKERQVKYNEAKALATFYGIEYIETSSRRGINVEDAFRCITEEIYDKVKLGDFKPEDGWDGVKTGFTKNDAPYTLVEAEPVKSGFCCY